MSLFRYWNKLFNLIETKKIRNKSVLLMISFLDLFSFIPIPRPPDQSKDCIWQSKISRSEQNDILGTFICRFIFLYFVTSTFLCTQICCTESLFSLCFVASQQKRQKLSTQLEWLSVAVFLLYLMLQSGKTHLTILQH